MKWAEMTPEQRDALVDEKVMGKTEPEICEFDPSMTVMTSGSEPDSFDWHCYKCGAHGKVTRDGYYQHPKAIPHYTTSMDAAWQVVEKFPFGYVQVQMYPLIEQYAHEHYSCAIVGKEKTFGAWGKTASEAICLVALKACGVEIE